MYNAETAHQTNRGYVFEDFAWDVSHALFPSSLHSEHYLVASALPMATGVG
jgi:hypothetical protein